MTKNIIDYQWPSAFQKKIIFNGFLSLKKNVNKILFIENFFKKKFGYDVKLFPSARSCIGVILRYLKIDRSDQVFINKWASHCVLNTFGAYTNISTSLKNSNLIYCVHKWGQIQNITYKKKGTKIIESSVDSIILKKNKLFFNNGDFEIFSLPKIIGSVAGGIVVSRNKDFIEFCKAEQNKNKQLGIYQARIKFKGFPPKKNNFETWMHLETWNTYLEMNTLNNICENLNNYDRNKNIIISRLEICSEIFKKKFFSSSRLGPVLPLFEKYLLGCKNLCNYFLLRNLPKKNSFNKFDKVFLLPLHFKISDIVFNNLIKKIKKNYLL